MRRVRSALAAGLVTVGLLTAACGIPTGGEPTAIAKSDVPFHLLSPATGPTGTTTTVSPAVGEPENIYLVAGQHVVARSRDVAVPPNLGDILGALLQGPTAEESAAGLQSFLIPKTQVSATVAAGIATINFTTNPVQAQVVGPDQTLAIAQVVFTATEQPGVTGVSFEIAGAPVAVPTASGAQVLGPVYRLSYLPQAPTP